MKNFLIIIISSLTIYFFSWLILYKLDINQLPIQSEDTIPALFLPLTILKEGTMNLDTYYPMMIEKYPHPDDKKYEIGLTPFYLRKIGEHYVSAFTIITPLASLPVFGIALALNTPITWENLAILAHISSSLLMAISGGILYLISRKHFDLSQKKSILISSIYLFGTINFALLSQGMWQHGTLELFSLLGIYFYLNFYKGRTKKSLILSGLLFSLAILSRPTAALALGLLGLLSLYHTLSKETPDKKIIEILKVALFWLIGIIPVALFFYWYNQTYYLDISNQGYSDQLGGSWLSPFPISLIGVWLSPSKGILIYSPIFIFSLISFFRIIFKKEELTLSDKRFFTISSIIFLLHTLIISLWKHWYGGWGFGYRMSSDIIPYLVLLLIPLFKSQFFERNKKIIFTSIIFSILVQIFGLIFFDGIWHAAYDNGFKDTAWLWSIKDSEIAFNIRRILVEVGYLEQACPKCLPK